jgi:plastocyanin
MRKGMWSAAAVIVLLSVAGVVPWGSTVQAADQIVMTDQLTYEPGEVTVPVGATVVWHNDSSVQHDAKAEDGSFSSPLLDKGKDFSFTFKTPGDVKFYCTVPGHKSAGMTGVVHVGAASTPTTAATTTTTRPGSTATTTVTTVPGQAATTTTTAKNGAAGSTTTTTAAVANGATTTTLAPSTTPTSAPEAAGETTTTNHNGEEAAEGGHGGGSKDDDKSSPIGIAFAVLSTLLLGGVAGKLLLSKP